MSERDETGRYTEFVSDESLDVIRANECEYDAPSLSTKRYRRMWNEIVDQRVAIAEARAVFGKLDLAGLHAESPYLHSIVRHAMDSLDAALCGQAVG